MTDVMSIGRGGPSTAETSFRAELAAAAAVEDRPLRVLELGTRRWIPDFATHHAAWAPPGVEWIKSDMEAGVDVDVVADAHDLAGSNAQAFDLRFDAYVAVSVYEHLRRPWVAAESVRDVLRPGGLVYVATHQTFPLHGYPHDYFRFSREALAGIFDDAGFVIVDGGYTYPATITPPAEVDRWNPGAPAFLNVDVFAQVPG